MAVLKKKKLPVQTGLTGMPGQLVAAKPVPTLQLAPSYQQMPQFRTAMATTPYGGTIYKPTNPGWGQNPAYAKKTPVGKGYVTGYQPGVATDPTHPPYSPGGPSEDAFKNQINISGYSPNFGAGIEGDWEYQAALADLGYSDAADQAALNQALKSLAVQYGGDLSGLVQKGLIDQSAADAGKANEFSFTKELDRALGRGSAGAVEGLGSRGALRSGAMQVMQGQLQENYQREQTKGMNDLLAQIGGLRTGAAQAAASRRSNLATTRSNIAMRLAADPRYQPRSGGKATWNADYGGYMTPDGRLYDANGNLLY